jgi:hypothetical protein
MHMTGVQSIISLLLFAARVEKQVLNININCALKYYIFLTDIHSVESCQCLHELFSYSSISR